MTPPPSDAGPESGSGAAGAMMLLVSRFDAAGEPVVERSEVAWQEVPGYPMVRRGQLSDVASGEPRWHLSLFQTGAEVPHHATPSIDYLCVIEGEIELLLEKETVRLKPGDCVLQRGVEHGWRAVGDRPALVSAVTFPAPTNESAS